MRAIIICSFLFLFALTPSAQNFSEVDKKVRSYPNSFNSLEKLHQTIKNDFNKPKDRVRAIYTWIALHIEYDVKTYMKGTKPIKYTYRSDVEKLRKEKEIENKLALKTLKTRKAICHGYATLFKVLCEMSEIQCELITGTSKISNTDIGKEPQRVDHAWNAVKINNQWKLIDATWGAGYLNGQNMKFEKKYTDVFFFTEPEKFFYNHFPADKQWLLTNKNSKDFASLPLFYHTYLDSNIEVINPHKGIIKAKRGDTIEFVIRSEEKNRISYKFSNEKSGYNIEPKAKGDLLYYKIEVGSGSYLTIYLNQSALVAYKIH